MPEPMQRFVVMPKQMAGAAIRLVAGAAGGAGVAQRGPQSPVSDPAAVHVIVGGVDCVGIALRAIAVSAARGGNSLAAGSTQLPRGALDDLTSVVVRQLGLRARKHAEISEVANAAVTFWPTPIPVAVPLHRALAKCRDVTPTDDSSDGISISRDIVDDALQTVGFGLH